MLIAARFLQGVGGALSSAVILGMIVTLFPEPGEQARAIGVFSFVASAGASIGLLAGGVLTQTLDWHWIFFVNVPIGAAAWLLAARLLDPEVGAGWRAGADAPGAVLVTAALMLGVYTIVDAHSVALGVLAVALLAAFVARQATAARPLLPLRVLRSRNVVGANVAQMLMVAGMLGVFFLAVLYLQRVLGYDALATGVGVPPALDRDRDALARVLGAVEHALRRPCGAARVAWSRSRSAWRGSPARRSTGATSSTCCRR